MKRYQIGLGLLLIPAVSMGYTLFVEGGGPLHQYERAVPYYQQANPYNSGNPYNPYSQYRAVYDNRSYRNDGNKYGEPVKTLTGRQEGTLSQFVISPHSVNNPYSKAGNRYNNDTSYYPYNQQNPYNPYSTSKNQYDNRSIYYSSNYSRNVFDTRGDYRGSLNYIPYNSNSYRNPYNQYGNPYSPNSTQFPYNSPYRQ